MLYKTLLMAAVFFGFSLPRMSQNEPWIVHMPTPQPMVNKMLELAEVQRDHLVYDLGSGDGRIVITAAKKYGARGSHRHRPQRIREARKNARAAGVTDLVQFRQADLFERDFSPATVVTLYLLPSLNDLLRPKLLQQLQSRTLIVSHTFEITG
jgi:protein-L-isoaspartate O-methyltransferase